MSANGERPGVYARYEVTGVSYSGAAAGTVGVAAESANGTAGEIYGIGSYAAAVSAFGSSAPLTGLVGMLIKNGVKTIKAVPLGTSPANSAYSAAFAALAADEDVKIIICDKQNGDIAGLMKTAILGADQRNIHKMGIAEGTGNVSSDTAAALVLNSERMILVSPAALDEEGNAAAGGMLSAAVAGAIVSKTDPALPINGAELYGLGGVDKAFTDGEITTLVQGGVTPVECVGGKVTAVRGITTRTRTGGAADATYREITTTRIIDDVIPTVRNALAASFAGSKNNARTRGAIRTRVILELEKKLAAEIIDGYGAVSAAVNADDPTVCDVSFEFTVAHGLNQICLSAYITV